MTAKARSIAGLVGPTIAATVVAEFPLVQPRLYDAQIPPVVYLSGVLLFVGGLAVVRAYNLWRRDWTILVTVSGWLAILLGLLRMFAASFYQRTAANTGRSTLMVFEGCLLAAAVVMTFKAYSPQLR